MSSAAEARARAKLANLGLTLPATPKPMASYRRSTRSGNLLYVCGTGPMQDGKVAMTGKLGRDLTREKGYEAARLCALNSLAIVEADAGSLDAVRQVVKATVYVACDPTFVDHPKVADGATDLLRELYGAEGLPARAAVGVPALPMDIPVELELIVELR
ncbi:MAG: RidA family protein [Thermoplasmatota archaeon]